MPPSDRDELRREINQCKHAYHLGQIGWSFAHHFACYGAPILGAVAALAVTLAWGKPIESVTTIGTALLAGLATAGAFQSKWQIYRRSRSRTDQLLIRLESPEPDLGELRAELVQIVADTDNLLLKAEDEVVSEIARQDKAEKDAKLGA